METKRFAVLFDADNNSKDYIKTVIDEITNEGTITYKRMYGDWTSTQLQPMKSCLLDYAITPIQQYSYTKGKNATDSAMIIDAMDILYTGNVEGFCLVSSDSDFTRLAIRLREAGKMVVGMGRKQTPKPFITACNKFIFLDLINEKNENNDNEEKDSLKTKSGDSGNNSKESSKTPLNIIKNAITKIIMENEDDDGWLLVSRVKELMQKKYSDFDNRNYGFKQMVPFLESLDYEINRQFNPENKTNPTGCTVYVRIKKKA